MPKIQVVLIFVLFLTPGLVKGDSPDPLFMGVVTIGVVTYLEPKGGGKEASIQNQVSQATLEAVRDILPEGAPIEVSALTPMDSRLHDPQTLVLLVHGNVANAKSAGLAETGRILTLSLDVYRNHPDAIGGNLFPAAPEAVAFREWSAPETQARLAQALHRMTAALLSPLQPVPLDGPQR